MTIYSFHIFDRHCVCVYRVRYNTAKATPSSGTQADAQSKLLPNTSINEAGQANSGAVGGMAGSSVENFHDEEAKLIYGVVFSLRNIVNKLVAGKPSNDGFLSFKTNVYKLHYFETASNMKFVMITDRDCETLSDVLRHIYSSIYVDFVVRNAWSSLGRANDDLDQSAKERGDSKGGGGGKKYKKSVSTQITNELFKTNLNKYLRALPSFS